MANVEFFTELFFYSEHLCKWEYNTVWKVTHQDDYHTYLQTKKLTTLPEVL